MIFPQLIDPTIGFFDLDDTGYGSVAPVESRLDRDAIRLIAKKHRLDIRFKKVDGEMCLRTRPRDAGAVGMKLGPFALTSGNNLFPKIRAAYALTPTKLPPEHARWFADRLPTQLGDAWILRRATPRVWIEDLFWLSIGGKWMRIQLRSDKTWGVESMDEDAALSLISSGALQRLPANKQLW